MDEGKLERGCAGSLTVSEFEGAFHKGDACFIYNWIDDEHGDSDPEGPRESIEDWMTDQSYQDADEEPIEQSCLCINSGGGFIKRENPNNSLLLHYCLE